ncbi:MAG: hypothetical protein NZ526_08500, partial [Aquificaceae bacterium]|nr:hypothetical protein [Aquificaceae bacterium]
QVRELIAHYRNLFNQLWNGILVLTGGLAGLSLSSDSPTADALLIMGLILWCVLFSLMVYALISSKKLIRRL